MYAIPAQSRRSTACPRDSKNPTTPQVGQYLEETNQGYAPAQSNLAFSCCIGEVDSSFDYLSELLVC